ncbi:MAG: NAD(P)-binding domain-containing protein [Microscillaceae bacterium]|nr:NAD(P)-binding domain-containing protein [Microscillaceae bacterium]
MKIAIIGTGNVGGALAKGFAKVGHEVLLGVRNPTDHKIKTLLDADARISAHEIREASEKAEVILLAIPPAAIFEIAQNLGNVTDKIIIDASNSVFVKPEPYLHVCAALRDLKPEVHLVKCFNTTGYENMENPHYGDTAIDMYVAGDSEQAKKVARTLAQEIGFGQVYDFGGFDKIPLIEQFAMVWINLAIMQKEGRNMAFQILKR